MEEHLRALLATLGHPVAWGGLGQGTALPRIVLWDISGNEGLTLDGADGVIRGRVQVDCYGAPYLQALTLARAVRGLLSGYRGGPITLMQLIGKGGRPEEAGGDVIQRVTLDFAVNYRA